MVEQIYFTTRVYDEVQFSVDTAGDYIVRTEASVDGQLVIYSGSFDPDSPEVNVRAGSDDCNFNFRVSKFPCLENPFIQFGAEPLTLSPGVEYFAVTTKSGFGSDVVPAFYSGSISGPSGATVTIGDGGGGEEPAEVDLAVTPLVTAIPTTGGKARFRTTVSNNSDARVEGDVVVMVNGVERRRLSSALTAGGSQSFTVNLSFSARVPAGIYQVSLMAVADGEMLDMEGSFDVVVGDVPRLAHPSAVVAQFKSGR